MIFLLLALTAFIFYVQRYSLDSSLQGVAYQRHLSRLLAAPDEQVEMITTLTNRRRILLPFLRLTEFLPKEADLQATVTGTYREGKSLSTLVSTTYLMPRSKLVRTVGFSLPSRGRYLFTGAELSGGDFLGLNEKRVRIDSFCELVVYPRETSENEIHEAFGGFLGDLSVRRFIIEDPVLTVGFRDYTGREPLKAISWTQSARSNRIMVKNYDYTTELSVTVLLNVECDAPDKEALLEQCFSITHTVCRMLEDRGIKYDFFTNATTAGAFDMWSYLAEGLGDRHFMTILEGLGRASYQHVEPFGKTLSRVERSQGHRGLVIITPAEIAAASINALTERGEWWAKVITPGEAAS